ncbi:hypothetical protein Q1695_011105 [Nippostrongylus brasiliensis]|nr:hypothetical protein Q1695_011105 [Nippostrongylus brasiliensis]
MYDSKPPLLLSEESSEHDSTELTQCEQEEEGPVPESRKTVMVMPEDIEAAGLSMQNLSELTESQFNALVLIAERRQRASESVVASELPQREQYDDQIAGTSSAEESITMVITDDGSLKLTDASGQTFSFDGDQLAALRIDVNNLTDESIQQIVQLAMPAINISSKNLELEKSDLDRCQRPHAMASNEESRAACFKNDVQPHIVNNQIPGRLSNQGQMRNASIRYVKNGKCKVQYEDGRFEWIGEDSVDLCNVKSSTPHHSDHSGYHAGGISQESEPATIVVDAPHLKRPSSTEAAALCAGANSPKRRAVVPNPNFCCPVCDRKVYQKEPSYIVIRLPACDDCTKERMIVLDERAKRPPLAFCQK